MKYKTHHLPHWKPRNTKGELIYNAAARLLVLIHGARHDTPQTWRAGKIKGPTTAKQKSRYHVEKLKSLEKLKKLKKYPHR